FYPYPIILVEYFDLGCRIGCFFEHISFVKHGKLFVLQLQPRWFFLKRSSFGKGDFLFLFPVPQVGTMTLHFPKGGSNRCPAEIGWKLVKTSIEILILWGGV